MVYARCLYQIVMWADSRQRAAHTVTRGRLTVFLRHACRLLGCELRRTEIGDGHVALLVELNVDVAIALFVGSLRSWTSAWIAGGEHGYWTKVDYRAISPEDRDLTTTMGPTGTPLTPNGLTAQAMHHIILITSRHRLLIPVKYRGLMAEVATGCARDLGGAVVACSAMRNHLHLLCGVPPHVSISQFIDMLRCSLLQHMLANPHLRRAEGWSEHSVAYTVSYTHILDEEHTIADQESIHRCRTLNEMSPLYQRVGIPYVTSLR